MGNIYKRDKETTNLPIALGTIENIDTELLRHSTGHPSGAYLLHGIIPELKARCSFHQELPLPSASVKAWSRFVLRVLGLPNLSSSYRNTLVAMVFRRGQHQVAASQDQTEIFGAALNSRL